MNTCLPGLCLSILLFSSTTYGQAAATPEDGLLTSFDELALFVQRDSVPHKARTEAAIIEIPTKLSDQSGPLVVRWDTGSGVIHFIQAMPVKIKKEQLGAVEEAALRLNHGMPLPGFGVNHAASVVYYRLTVPLQPRGGLKGNEVRAYFSYAFKQANEFTSTFAAVASGNVPPEKAIAFYQSTKQAPQSPLSGTFQAKAMGSVWTMVLKPDFTGVIKRNDVVGAETKFELEEGQITFRDTGGPMSCMGTNETPDPGVYKFELKEGTLSFEKVSDDCGGRAAVLVAGPWKQIEEAAKDSP